MTPAPCRIARVRGRLGGVTPPTPWRGSTAIETLGSSFYQEVTPARFPVRGRCGGATTARRPASDWIA